MLGPVELRIGLLRNALEGGGITWGTTTKLTKKTKIRRRRIFISWLLMFPGEPSWHTSVSSTKWLRIRCFFLLISESLTNQRDQSKVARHFWNLGIAMQFNLRTLDSLVIPSCKPSSFPTFRQNSTKLKLKSKPYSSHSFFQRGKYWKKVGQGIWLVHYPLHPLTLLFAHRASAQSNSALTFPNNVYRHTC